MKSKKKVRLIVSVLAVCVFIWLLSFVDFSTLVAELSVLPVWIVVYVFITLFFLYAAKAYRFRILNPNMPFNTMLVAVIYQNFFLGLLPMRLGELAYVKYLREHHISISKLVSDIIVVRVFDVMVIVVFGVFTIPLVIDIAFWLHMVILLAVSVTLGIIISRSDWLLGGVIRLLDMGKKRFSVIVHLIKLFQHMQSIDIRNRITLIITSFVVWAIACVVWIPVVEVLTGLNLPEIIMSSLVAWVISLLPVSPAAGIGVVEGGWTAGLMLFDVPINTAVLTALLSHILAIAAVCFFSVVAKLYDIRLEFKKNKGSFL